MNLKLAALSILTVISVSPVAFSADMNGMFAISCRAADATEASVVTADAINFIGEKGLLKVISDASLPTLISLDKNECSIAINSKYKVIGKAAETPIMLTCFKGSSAQVQETATSALKVSNGKLMAATMTYKLRAADVFEVKGNCAITLTPGLNLSITK